jgi:hypothetical protein
MDHRIRAVQSSERRVEVGEVGRKGLLAVVLSADLTHVDQAKLVGDIVQATKQDGPDPAGGSSDDKSFHMDLSGLCPEGGGKYSVRPVR